MKHFIIRFLTVAILLQSTVYAQKKQATRPSGYGKASYNTSQAGSFMKTWLIAGPVSVKNGSETPDNSRQEKAFKEDAISTVTIAKNKPVPSVQVNQKQLNWKLISSIKEDVILDTFFGQANTDYAYAYALAEIKADQPGTYLLGVGSDDAIKIWLNGKLVHEIWAPRGIVKDEDIIPLQLVKGSNQILLKVQDIAGGWGFMVRLMDKAALSDQLGGAAGIGDVEKMEMLIARGADVNAKNAAGITPIVSAKISGRQEVVDFLIKKGATDEVVPDPATLLDAYYSSLNNKEASGIAVLVSRDGKVLYEKGFGYADIKGKKKVTPDTKFRIGSVTKQFTAAAILKLQEKGLLSVHDKLSKYIPDYPRGDEVIIHHLLTHSSGIHSYTNKPDFISRVTATITDDSLIRSFKNDKYDFNPGENFLYNNSGYFLLGYIIGKVSGMSYADYLKQTFFEPLGMKNTGVHYAGIKLENEARGYAINNGKYEEAINWDMSWAGAAGAMYSTLADLDKWNTALHSGRVLSEASLKMALTVVELKNGVKPGMNYGYGLVMDKYRSVDYIGHSGGLHGFITQLVYYPKQKLTVVMFSNNAGPEVNFDPNMIAEAFLWNEMEKKVANKVTTVSPEVMQQYVGRYDFSQGMVMNITMENNKLMAQLSGQPKFEIFPASENEFFWKVVDARIIFVKNEKGEVTHGAFTQSGHKLTVPKLKEATIISIDAALLDAYVGKYKLESIDLTITKSNGKLYAQEPGDQKMELLPISETQFVVKEFNAKLTFVKEGGGKANKIILNMNGTDRELPRTE